MHTYMHTYIKNTRILGLDASSSCVGISVIELNKKPKLIHYEYYIPDKKNHSELERIKHMKIYLYKLIDKYKITDVAIEEYIKFLPGKSQAKTILPLVAWNRAICFAVYEKLNREPHMYAVSTIRAKMKPKGGKTPSKEEIPDLVSKYLNFEFPWEFKIISRGKNKGKKELLATNYDLADSMAVALTHAYKILESKSKNKCKPKKR